MTKLLLDKPLSRLSDLWPVGCQDFCSGWGMAVAYVPQSLCPVFADIHTRQLLLLPLAPKCSVPQYPGGNGCPGSESSEIWPDDRWLQGGSVWPPHYHTMPWAIIWISIEKDIDIEKDSWRKWTHSVFMPICTTLLCKRIVATVKNQFWEGMSQWQIQPSQ